MWPRELNFKGFLWCVAINIVTLAVTGWYRTNFPWTATIYDL